MEGDYFEAPRARRQQVREDTEKGRFEQAIMSKNGADMIDDGESNQPFYMTARFWKRFSVFFSIGLSIASLILSAYASLTHPTPSKLRALTVTGIIINSVSISISALTSLDWKKQATHDKAFVAQLVKVAQVHGGDGVVVTQKVGGEEMVRRRLV